MSDENQAPRAPGDPGTHSGDPSALHPALEFLETPPRDPGAQGPPAPGAFPPLPRRTLYGALALALLGLAALAFGQVEASFLIAVATLYFLAQGADVHPALGRVYALLGWVPPVMGAMLLSALAAMLAGQAPHGPAQVGFAVFSGAGALACLASLMPAVADRLVPLFFRGAGPSHVLRLTARFALAILWMAAPAALALRDLMDGLLLDPAELVSASKLSGGLVGYVVLAFASVGFLVRRNGRAALQRLGLIAPRLADSLTVLAGIVVLWLFNIGSESLERSLFPALWAGDQAFTAALAGYMGPGLMVLLGLSAGIGEEITLRGALQPKLGIALTSLLFAVLHVQYSWYGMLSILVFGLILGTIRKRRGTTAAILVHALYDLLAVAASKT